MATPGERQALEAIIAGKTCAQGHTWREIGAAVGLDMNAVRCRWKRRSPEAKPASSCPVCKQQSREGTGQREQAAFEEHGNCAQAESLSGRVKTLDELLAACQVDLTVWRVRDWGVKKWEVGAKIKTGDLTWTDGVMDGHLDYQGLGIQDLWSVWAKFVRIEPVLTFPTIRPVIVSAALAPPPERERRGGRSLVASDLHYGFILRGGRLVPFHDRQALDVVLQLAHLLEMDSIYLLGDGLDLALMTDKFLRSPELEHTTQPAIVELHWWLQQLRRACPNARIVMHEGNHDERLRESMIVHLRAAYGLRPADELDQPELLSMPRLLALSSLGVEWVGDYPNDESWLTDTLRLTHGDRVNSVPGATSRAMVENGDVSVIFGHIHRREAASRTIWNRGQPRNIEARSFGCLCRIDGLVPGSNAGRQNWQQGCGVVDYADGIATISDVPITGGRAVWGGAVIVGRDRLDDLRRDCPRWAW